ncbi:MAG TPA: ribonuclease P protein component [Usitatibacter sp.]|nr:ribonuclease P protein component [Usitatibacter sp.]
MPPRERAHALSRRHRITPQGSFGPILRNGRKFRGDKLVLHALPGHGCSRIGVALARRLVPLAVDRNRVKRAVREAFRRHDVKGSAVDCVVALREKMGRVDVAEIERELARLLDELQRSERR